MTGRFHPGVKRQLSAQTAVHVQVFALAAVAQAVLRKNRFKAGSVRPRVRPVFICLLRADGGKRVKRRVVRKPSDACVGAGLVRQADNRADDGGIRLGIRGDGGGGRGELYLRLHGAIPFALCHDGYCAVAFRFGRNSNRPIRI